MTENRTRNTKRGMLCREPVLVGGAGAWSPSASAAQAGLGDAGTIHSVQQQMELINCSASNPAKGNGKRWLRGTPGKSCYKLTLVLW